MRLFEKSEAKPLSIGLYVKFARSQARFAKCETRRIGAWQQEVTIYIPDGGDPTSRAQQISRFLNIVQDGRCWPLRIDWNSAKDYLTLEQIGSIERMLVDIPVYVYGVPNPTRHSLDLDGLYRQKMAARMRQRRAGGG